MSWGLTPWGLSPWGIPGGPLFLISAEAISTHTVRVTYSQEAKHSFPLVDGDALNPSTWVITRLDTGQVFTVLSVAHHDVTECDIRVAEAFGDFQVSHTIESTTLRKMDGSLIQDPTVVQFRGVIADTDATNEAKSAKRGVGIYDLVNVPAATQDAVGGTLQIGQNGDYAIVTGEEMVRKLIIRRLITKPGDFSHLPAYGIGLAVKELLPASDLVKLRAEIERQVLLEPEVEACRASLALQASDNILLVQLKAKLAKTGQEVDVAFNLAANQFIQL